MSERDGGAPGRLLSLDALRGFVMLLMASGGLGISAVAREYADSQLWQLLDRQLDHVEWQGCSAWDLIQPSFLFIVGVAMPYSYANRRAHGQSWRRLFAHAVGRSLVLVALGVFLASAWSPRTNFTFTNVLAQIGLGYTFVFLTLGRRPWIPVVAAFVILVGYWLFFALHTVPKVGTPEALLGLPLNWKDLTGFARHWEKNINAAAQVDHWFLNRFPRPDGKTFVFNDGGYTTLNFIPSIATMLLGVVAGEWLRSSRSGTAKVQALLVVGALGIVIGTVLDGSVCPVVKRIWTPSWVIFSAGWVCWLLALFYGTIDVAGWRRWSFPFVVVGANSIAMYLMAQLSKPFIFSQLKIHFGQHTFDVPYDGVDFGPIVQSAAVLLVLWLVCFWMYRQKIFVKI